jgi:LmbE family N-acetylglucosaminyl deacetylase
VTSFSAPPVARVTPMPPRGRVLVIAPHPDDETFGPGATLALHARQGDPIHAVFVCSGIQGDPDGLFDRDKLPLMREAEARAAGAILGIGRFTFFGYPDNLNDADYGSVFGDLPRGGDAQRRALVDGLASRLSDVVGAERPDVVYHPWAGEVNADHWAVAMAIERARATHPEWRGAVCFFGYEIWAACQPDVVVDVSDTFDVKIRAIAEYRSQLAYHDYGPVVRGLAAYRSLLLERGATWGEAFVGGVDA